MSRKRQTGPGPQTQIYRQAHLPHLESLGGRLLVHLNSPCRLFLPSSLTPSRHHTLTTTLPAGMPLSKVLQEGIPTLANEKRRRRTREPWAGILGTRERGRALDRLSRPLHGSRSASLAQVPLVYFSQRKAFGFGKCPRSGLADLLGTYLPLQRPSLRLRTAKLLCMAILEQLLLSGEQELLLLLADHLLLVFHGRAKRFDLLLRGNKSFLISELHLPLLGSGSHLQLLLLHKFKPLLLLARQLRQHLLVVYLLLLL